MIELGFLLVLAFLVILPLAPSLRTWWYRLDSRPLRIHSRYAHEFHRAPDAPALRALAHSALWNAGDPDLSSAGGTVLPSGTSVGAMRATGAVHWESLATIDGWLDAEGDVVAGSGAMMTGSCASHGWLQIDNESSFERLAGMPVHFGTSPDSLWAPRGPKSTGNAAPDSGRAGAERRAFVSGSMERTVVDGNLVIDADEVVHGSLVVRGNITLGPGAVVNGSIKCYGNLVLGDTGRVNGSVFSRKSIVLGAGSFVAGPCVADESLILGMGSVVGTGSAQATVSAERIEAHETARVYGIVHAMTQGRVAA